MPKTTKIPVPGSDVTLDFTEAFGGVHYNERTITLVFLSLKPWSTQMAQDSTVKNALHGQKMHVLFSDDPGYFWTGRVNVGDWEYYQGAGRCTVTIDAEPYKHKVTQTEIVVNPGNNKNLLQYFDSFEVIPGGEVYYVKSAAIEASAFNTSYARDGGKVLRLTSSDDVSNAYVFIGSASSDYAQVRCVPGKYVFSFYVRNTIGSATVQARVYGRSTRGTNWSDTSLFNILGTKEVTVTGDYIRVEIPITVISQYPYVCVRFLMRTANTSVYIDCMQLEKTDGDAATEWTAYTNVSGSESVTLTNGDRENLSPLISATASATLSWGGYSVTISDVTNMRVPQLIVERGSLTLTVESAGIVSFVYREGSL